MDPKEIFNGMSDEALLETANEALATAKQRGLVVPITSEVAVETAHDSAFDCFSNCSRRRKLIGEMARVGKERDIAQRNKAEWMPDVINREMDLQDGFKSIAPAEVSADFPSSPLGGLLTCNTIPECQEACPLPLDDGENYTQVAEKVMDFMKQKGW